MQAYLMPFFVKLAVSNMEHALKWYKEVGSFSSIYELPDGEGRVVMAHIRREAYQDIMLVEQPDTNAARGQGVMLNFTVDDVAPLFKQAEEINAEIIEGPIDRPWNARELVLKDPDGYLLTFSMQIDKGKSFDEVAEQIKVG
ncbi:VOC family protein [Bacillus xiapuensis]|uniref:VOC family protein n=1 Tax=Bacillus xiapuensis TaxID=2014075 RepID=UPI000C24DE7F|nr:VOC family protein [Bacillus xiapuensis]